MSSIAPLPLPLDGERGALLDRLVEGLDTDALLWLSGYVAGLARAHRPAAGVVPGPAAEPAAAAQATVLYGSQTGNARRIGEKLREQLAAAGLPARLASTADYRPKELAAEKLLFLVVSTHGEGEPPDDARAFCEFVLGKRAPQLAGLAYAVFGLGDSSYPKFCETARQLDARLTELGARRLLDRVDADVDFDGPAADWLARTTSIARDELGEARTAIVRQLRAAPATQIAGREAPQEAEVLANQPITSDDAVRRVHHLELALPEGAFPYEPGDALGIWPVNPAPAVGRIAALLGAREGTDVHVDGHCRTLGDWLATAREITRLTRPFLVRHAERARDPALTELLAAGREAELRDFMRGAQLIDVLERFPADWSPAELVAALRPLAPRLYSIASSRKAVGEEAHLTVALVDGPDAREGRRVGAASTYLAGRPADGRVAAFLEANPRFRLPEDPSTDLIMIGAGTGVAPYRAFLQDRVEDGAAGRHWLFFGSRHLRRDFLYQAEWLEALKRGSLHRLDVAFSRDGGGKRYVQHVLEERGAELWRWLEGGARVYVCGDAERMAPDVDAALARVVERHGSRSREGAREYLAALAADRRYLRDVY